MHTILLLHCIIEMYILYSLQCPSPGDSSLCMHWNAIARALWKLLTATNPRTPTHLAAGPLPQWPHVNEEWVGIQGYLKFKKDFSGTYDFATVILATLMIFDPWKTCLKVGDISPISHSTRPGEKKTSIKPISLDIAVTWWAGWSSKWSIRLIWVMYDKAKFILQPLWIEISSIQKISSIPSHRSFPTYPARAPRLQHNLLRWCHRQIAWWHLTKHHLQQGEDLRSG